MNQNEHDENANKNFQINVRNIQRFLLLIYENAMNLLDDCYGIRPYVENKWIEIEQSFGS